MPFVTVTETITDNYRLSTNSPESDAITQIGAGVRLYGGRRIFDGSIDYGFTLNRYLRHPNNNYQSFQQNLNARVKSAFADNHGYVEASATI